MAGIRPFKAIRPRAGNADQLISRAYLSYTRRELIATLDQNPDSFLHVINPEYHKKNRSPPNSVERFQKTRERFEEFMKKGILQEAPQKGLYLYQQRTRAHSYLGIIGCATVDDALNGTIRKHEKTLAEREKLMTRYLRTCDINAEPVLLTYRDDEEIERIIDRITSDPPEFDLSAPDDGTQHRLWPVTDPMSIQRLQERFADKDALYIADGHHRSASSVRLAQEKRKENPNFTGEEGFNFYMAYFLPESQLTIQGYHRLVKDLNGLSSEAFLEALNKDFEVQSAKKSTETAVHRIKLFLEGNWFSLIPRKGSYQEDDPRSSLDAEILQEKVLEPLLNIDDPRTSKRIDFPGMLDKTEDIETLVRKRGIAAAFVLHPVTLEQLKAVADAGEIMPPKTTWTEPKLRSGLTIYRMGIV